MVQMRPVALTRKSLLRLVAALDAHPRLRWTATLLWGAAIFWLSSQSRPLGRRWPALPSALAHVFEFGVLAALLHRILSAGPARHRRPAALAFLLTALYAASDEAHQALVPERIASPAEYGLDLLGASLGLAVSRRRIPLPVRRARLREEEE